MFSWGFYASPELRIFYYLTSTKLYKLISSIPISITSIYLTYHKHRSFCPTKLAFFSVVFLQKKTGLPYSPYPSERLFESHSICLWSLSNPNYIPILSYFSDLLFFLFYFFPNRGSRHWALVPTGLLFSFLLSFDCDPVRLFPFPFPLPSCFTSSQIKIY